MSYFLELKTATELSGEVQNLNPLNILSINLIMK